MANRNLYENYFLVKLDIDFQQTDLKLGKFMKIFPLFYRKVNRFYPRKLLVLVCSVQKWVHKSTLANNPHRL